MSIRQDIIQPAKRVRTIFDEFFRLEASGGVLLIAFSILALVWANSPWKDAYFALWQTKLTFGLGDWALSKALLLWINDGLMAIFFFVVGLEIKREVMYGELASFKRAALPLAAAIGGMVLPALLYVAFNAGQPGARGWGVPMATDIAFTLGVLALLGRRVPLALKVFVTALAIVDDIGAVLVIALFYTSQISWISLAAAAGILVLLFALNRARVHSPMPYLMLGVILWLAFLYSGVHATIAGVLLAMTIPARAHANRQAFVDAAHQALRMYEQSLEQTAESGVSIREAATWALEIASERAESTLQQLEHELHPIVIYVIMPIFALSNAGIDFSEIRVVEAVTSPVALGIIAGLVVGKSVGISLLTWLAVRFKLAVLPKSLTWRHVVGAAFLAGIGFTMSLFIANLAFVEPARLATSKAGILTASLISGLVGWTLLRQGEEVTTITGPQHQAVQSEG